MAPSIFDTRWTLPKFVTCIGLSASVPVGGISPKPYLHGLCPEKGICSAWNYDVRLQSSWIPGSLRGRSFASFALGYGPATPKLPTLYPRAICSTSTWLGLSATSPILNGQHFPSSLQGRRVLGGVFAFANGSQAVRRVHNSAGPGHRTSNPVGEFVNLTAINATQPQTIPGNYETFQFPQLLIQPPDTSYSTLSCGEVVCPLWTQYPDTYPLCQARCSGHEKDRIRWLRRHLTEQHASHLSKEKLKEAVRMTRVKSPENHDLDRRKRRDSKLSDRDVFETIFLRVRYVLNGTPYNVKIERCKLSLGHAGHHNSSQNDSGIRRSLSNKSERKRPLPSSSPPGSGTNSPTPLKYQVQSISHSLEHLSSFAASHPNHAHTIENCVSHIHDLVKTCEKSTMFNRFADNSEHIMRPAQYPQSSSSAHGVSDALEPRSGVSNVDQELAWPSPSRSAASGESRMPIPQLHLRDTASGSFTTSSSYVPGEQTWQESINFTEGPSDLTRVMTHLSSASSTGNSYPSHIRRVNQIPTSIYSDTYMPNNQNPSINDAQMSDPREPIPLSQVDLQGVQGSGSQNALLCPRCNRQYGYCNCQIADQQMY